LDRFPSLFASTPFDPSWVRRAWLFRTPYAQPIPPLNHSRSIPALKTFALACGWRAWSQVYPWDRGTNFAVEVAGAPPPKCPLRCRRPALRDRLAERRWHSDFSNVVA
jgi:hypothetical protein